MTIGYKQKDSSGPLYNPERDYAYITPTLMCQAVENMEADDNGELRDWRTKENITAAEIVKVTEALANAQRDFVNSADPVASLQQALERYGFYDMRLPVRLLLLANIGEIIVGAWFQAVREVTIVGQESPAQNEMCRFSSTVREFTQRMGAPIIDPNTTAEHLLYRNNILRAQINELRGHLREASDETLRQIKKNEELEKKKKQDTLSWINVVLKTIAPLFNSKGK